MNLKQLEKIRGLVQKIYDAIVEDSAGLYRLEETVTELADIVEDNIMRVLYEEYCERIGRKPAPRD